MKKPNLFLVALAGSLLLANAANSQTVATDPVGFVQPFVTTPGSVNMLANSDTQVSVPFTRPPEFVGGTQSATSTTLTVTGTPWTANQFVYVAGTQPKTYFVLIGPHATTNPKEGRMYTVASNTTNQLTLTTAGDDLSTVAANTQILVIPYNTLNSIFPASDAGISYIVSASALSRQTQIFIPDYSGSGSNLAPSITYYYINSGANVGWRKVGALSTDPHGDDALPNAGYFTVRNPGTGTTLTTLGSVLTKKASIPLLTRVGAATDATKATDNFVSVIRPVDVQLNDLGLISSGAFITSNSALSRTDQLFVFNPAAIGQNKTPSTTYYYLNGAWRKVGQAATSDFGTDTIPAGSGFIIRKAGTATGAASYWTNAPTY